ncbi:hypothetical protein DKM19_37440 [Streptosporangium sp. 'caverna']|nr:hypothetical protein DKM19_37440 [Streptosporangium sp. 'caverna']
MSFFIASARTMTDWYLAETSDAGTRAALRLRGQLLRRSTAAWPEPRLHGMDVDDTKARLGR